ncbi:hypothetical protein [Ruegeria hyattellae]|uniref:hypothetical protein n=1 Tax=Ruegeria hyattellae TaxID=3233337 RepID=UPI00355C65CA
MAVMRRFQTLQSQPFDPIRHNFMLRCRPQEQTFAASAACLPGQLAAMRTMLPFLASYLKLFEDGQLMSHQDQLAKLNGM